MILDAESAAIMKVAAILNPYMTLRQTGLVTVGNDQPLRPELERWIRGRIEFIQAGVDQCPEWFRKQLHDFDPNLRCRWDFYKQCWVVEHLSYFDNLYHTCGTWDKALGTELIEHLRKNDTWQTTPEDIVKERRRIAEQAQKSNDAKIADELYGVIDNMTHKQVEQFVEASEAIAHGEKVIPMGEDAKFMQHLHDRNLELAKQGIDVPDKPEMCINPEMKPGVYKRKRRKD